MKEVTQKGKLIVHIGLPKTATTTLQKDVFPKLASNQVKYLGTVQPREKVPVKNLYYHFYRAVEKTEYINNVRILLDKEISKGHTLIISEEMFTVSSGNTTWKKKLENVGEIVRGFNYIIVVSVREPSSALFSYYCELYPMFAATKKSFLECALTSEDMQIYHYEKLIIELYKHFDQQKINFIKFEDIIKGKVGELLQIIDPSIDKNILLNIKNQNKRKKTTTHIISPKSFTLADVFRSIIQTLSINNISIIKWINKVLKPLFKQLEKIKLKNIKIRKPSDDEMIELKLQLAKETEALNSLLRVKYE